MNRITRILCAETVLQVIQNPGWAGDTQHGYDHSYFVWHARDKGSEASQLQASGVQASKFVLLSHI